MDKFSLAAVGAGCIAAINIAALSVGIDGTLTIGCVGSIAAIIGGAIGYKLK